MKRSEVVLLSVIACLLAGATSFAQGKESSPALDKSSGLLASSFKRPPDSARAHTWWHWMNGNITAEGITKDLEAMKQAGLGGFQVFDVANEIPPGPIVYDSEEWHALMAHTIHEAARLGLEMCFHNCPGWSASGGTWIPPEHSMLEVTWSEQQVSGGGQQQGITLEQPTTRLDYYRDITVLAFPTPVAEQKGEKGVRLKKWEGKAAAVKSWNAERFEYENRKVGEADTIDPDRIIDLTDRMDTAGRLTWIPPSNSPYTIVRFGYTTTGKSPGPNRDAVRGLECNKLDREAVDLQWKEIVQRVMADAGEHAGRVFNSVLVDSYEARTQNWTHDFAEQFRRRRGYDLISWMPCMTGRVVGDTERSERFLWDLRRTINDLITENFFGRFAELCHENGMTLSCEPYGNGGFDEFQAAQLADMPMGEFWMNQFSKGRTGLARTSRFAASAAHIGGKRVVGAEAFTAENKNAAWNAHPYAIKAQGDYEYASGINRVIFHTFAHQPWPDDVLPGMTMGQYGMQMNRNNTWFRHARPWFDYLARCQYLLQEGRFAADLLYIYGDQDTGSRNDLSKDEMSPVPTNGYDYDCGGADTLMDLSVEDGHLVLPSGMRYRVLVLTRMKYTRPERLAKVAELVEAGAVVVGERPVASPSLENYPACDEQVDALAARLWDRQLISAPGELEAVLAKLKLLPDFETPEEDGVVFIHRIIDGKDVYFVSNQKPAALTVRCLFRVGGRIPELWHPDTGRIKTAPVWEPAGENRTAVTLDFDPAGSVFVVFDRPAESVDPIAEVSFRPLAPEDGSMIEMRVAEGTEQALAYQPGMMTVRRASGKADEVKVLSVEEPVQLNGPWTVSFGRMGPEPPVSFPNLIPWNEHDNDDIKHYSGAATYRASFDYSAPSTPHGLFLDLGEVQVMARVKLNGHDLGLLWKPPFRVDAGDAIRPGKNELEVTVVNLWVNRLIGDERYPDLFKRLAGGKHGGRGATEIPAWLLEGKERPETRRKTVTTYRHWEKDEPLLPSGLIGPVRLLRPSLVPMPPAR